MPLHYSDPGTEIGMNRSTNNKEFPLLCFSRASVSHLFYQSVVGSIQVEFSQVVPVSEDQVGLLFCTQVADRKHMPQDYLAMRNQQNAKTCQERASPDVDLQMVGSLGLSSKPSTHRQWKLPCVLMQR